MVKHIQTIRWQQPANCLSVFEHFVGLALKRLISSVKLTNSILLKNYYKVTSGCISILQKQFLLTCSELWVHYIIGNDKELTLTKWMNSIFSNQMLQITIEFCKNKKTLWLMFSNRIHLPQDFKATTRRLFIFNSQVLWNSWYLLPQSNERPFRVQWPSRL